MSQRLTAIPSPFGPRCLHVLLAAFSRFLGVLGRLGLAAHPSVISCPISSRRSDDFLAAFCGLLGMLLLPLLTHACPPSLRILFAVSTRKIPSRTHTSAARSANGCGAVWDASGHAGEAVYVSPNPHALTLRFRVALEFAVVLLVTLVVLVAASIGFFTQG